MSYVAIGDALVTYLNDPVRSFSESFVASRISIPIWELEAISSLTVEVYPISDSRQKVFRDEWQTEYALGIIIRDRAKTEARVDELLDLVDEVKNECGKIQELASLAVSAIDNSEPFEAATLAEHKLFSHIDVVRFTGTT